jgi:hypothetical protein
MLQDFRSQQDKVPFPVPAKSKVFSTRLVFFVLSIGSSSVLRQLSSFSVWWKQTDVTGPEAQKYVIGSTIFQRKTQQLF